MGPGVPTALDILVFPDLNTPDPSNQLITQLFLSWSRRVNTRGQGLFDQSTGIN